LRDDWEDADVVVSLIPVLPGSNAQFSRQRRNTYGYSDDSQENNRRHDLENQVKLSVENQKSKAQRLAKQKANVVWSGQTLKEDVRDKRKAKKRQRVKSQQFQPPPSPSTVPRKRGREEDDEDEDDQDGWAEIAREERMAKKVKNGEITQLEFDAELIRLPTLRR
jgi:ATP-dependent RNA helicase DDX55/SPB4